MGKKIAIITQYYKSYNFGGNLQAFALPKFLNDCGFEAEQICYSVNGETNYASLQQRLKAAWKRGLFKFLKQCTEVLLLRIKNSLNKKSISVLTSILDEKYKACEKFQLEYIPHTDEVYTDNTLKNLNKDFDVFITGSDQVFNYNQSKYGYWLEYVTKPKISYAASMALDAIPEDKIDFTKRALKDFKAIGVREEKTAKLYSELLKRTVELNVDPTLLLEKEDWDDVSSDRLVKEDYVFCYFLGSNTVERILAKRYAQSRRLKLVNIPFYKTEYKLHDMDYGDINFTYASPNDFISLIKYSNAIFTDSFHACVLSIIYHKEFVVFNRDKRGNMSSRIVSLMNVFHTEERFLHKDDLCTLDNVAAILNHDSNYYSEEFEIMKKSSVNYLLNNLNG